MSYKFTSDFSVGKKRYRVEGMGGTKDVLFSLSNAPRDGRVAFSLARTTAKLKFSRSASDEFIIESLRGYASDWVSEALRCSKRRIRWGAASLSWH